MTAASGSRVWHVGLAAAAVLFVTTLCCDAYDREAAVYYAKENSEDTGNSDGIFNDIAYYKYSAGDCANFVSQCLIDGGVRFRSSTDIADENTRGGPNTCDSRQRRGVRLEL